ncbi:MAG: hypothetical protein HFJ05_10000 [Eubacterium sp.]|nr:hypothetical protein [Eubacterium sp.]
MNIQDQLERILRELLVTVSRAPVSEVNEEYVLIHKRDVQRQLGSLRDVVALMMEQYEVTEQSRLHAELEVEKQRTEIIRSANHQAEDIYAASVIYTDDALGRIQNIIDEAEKSAKNILNRIGREMENERRRIRSNQVELMTQLEDMNDTAKYMRLIEERNKELAKAREKKQGKAARYEQDPKETSGIAITPEIKINEEYFEKAGLTPDGLPKEMTEGILKEAELEIAEEITPKEEIHYDKPVIKVNQEYYEKVKKVAEEQSEASQERKLLTQQGSKKDERRKGRFLLGKSSNRAGNSR